MSTGTGTEKLRCGALVTTCAGRTPDSWVHRSPEEERTDTEPRQVRSSVGLHGSAAFLDSTRLPVYALPRTKLAGPILLRVGCAGPVLPEGDRVSPGIRQSPGDDGLAHIPKTT